MSNEQSTGSADDKAHVSPSASPAKASPTAGGVTATGVPSASKHTPGPWRTKRGMDQMCDSGTTVASIVDAPNGPRWWIFSDANNHGDAEADARLIAAAPQLLEALRETNAWLSAFLNSTFDTTGKKAAREFSERIGAAAKAAGVTMIGTEALAKSRAAIAKAEGAKP